MAAPMIRRARAKTIFRIFSQNPLKDSFKYLSNTALLQGKNVTKRRTPTKQYTKRDDFARNFDFGPKFGQQHNLERSSQNGKISQVYEDELREYNKSSKSEAFFIPEHIKYQQLQGSDPKFGPVVMLAKNRQIREKRKQFILEGQRHILQAIDAGVKVNSIFFTKGELLEHFPLEALVAEGTELYKVKMGHMQLWSELVQASGIMAVCKTPREGEAMIPSSEQMPLTLVCENLRDSGNLGMLLRSAAAVGCERVILTAGCIDPWESKVIRASSGANYRLSILSAVPWTLLGNYLPESCHIYVTDGTGHHDMPEDFHRGDKKQIEQYEEDDAREVVDDGENHLAVDASYLDRKLVTAYSGAPIPVLDYYRATYTDTPVVLIVSGTPGGISCEAKKLVYERHGDALALPLTDSVPSLNTVIGASLIMFEMKKQFMLMKE